jgi:hypothetical protein
LGREEANTKSRHGRPGVRYWTCAFQPASSSCNGELGPRSDRLCNYRWAIIISPHLPRRRPTHPLRQFLLTRLAHQRRTPKFLQQFPHRNLPDSRNLIQLRSQCPRIAARPVKGDRKPMRLIANRLHQMQNRRKTLPMDASGWLMIPMASSVSAAACNRPSPPSISTSPGPYRPDSRDWYYCREITTPDGV